eukprot:gene2988-3271_t
MSELQATFQAVALGTATAGPGSFDAAAMALEAQGRTAAALPGAAVGASLAAERQLYWQTAEAGASTDDASGKGTAVPSGDDAVVSGNSTADGQLKLLLEDSTSSRSISMALRLLTQLSSLELVLLPADSSEDGDGGATAAAAASTTPDTKGGSTAWHAAGPPLVRLLLGDLPRKLQRLALSGLFQLCCGSSDWPSAAAGEVVTAREQQQLLLMLQVQDRLAACRLCGRTPAPAAVQRQQANGVSESPADLVAVAGLLGKLTLGLQHLPALRQLLLDLGLATKEQPALPDSCVDLWSEAGEQLLAALPACQVKHHAPVVC